MARRRKKNKLQTSKLLTVIILVVALVDLQLTYILAFLGRETAETLSVALVTEIVAVFAGYLIKAFNEKKEEEKIKLKRDMYDVPESEEEI